MSEMNIALAAFIFCILALDVNSTIKRSAAQSNPKPTIKHRVKMMGFRLIRKEHTNARVHFSSYVYASTRKEFAKIHDDICFWMHFHGDRNTYMGRILASILASELQPRFEPNMITGLSDHLKTFDPPAKEQTRRARLDRFSAGLIAAHAKRNAVNANGKPFPSPVKPRCDTSAR